MWAYMYSIDYVSSKEIRIQLKCLYKLHVYIIVSDVGDKWLLKKNLVHNMFMR